ncbi:MAG: hypothetical protein K6G22_12975 [Lachnospiraceae bacterium]|nr:hypothetical protein [Lachnospiraceae bacterium]
MKLIGLNELKKQMELIVSRADAYRKGGARLPHIVMNLTHENGQSLVAAYIASVLHDNGLRGFHGLDILLEYSLDGSLKQLKNVFADIKSNAVYTNQYEGVVAIDISGLSEYINEYQMEYFIEEIGSVARNATVIIYYDESLGKRMQLIKDKVSEAIGNHINVTVPPYSTKEYSEIVVQNIMERGILVESEEELTKILCDAVDRYHVTSAKEAVAVAEDLVFCADYSDFTPRINVRSVSRHLEKGKLCS